MFTSIKSTLIIASLSLAGSLALVGCVADASQDDEARDDTGTEERVGSAEEAVNNAWTGETSDGLPAIVCDSGSLMSTVRCTGRYCDNISTYCQNDGKGKPAASRWTPYFSEETVGVTLCNADEWVTSISCTGDYCDNVALQCTKLTAPYVVHSSCQWTGWVSEEYSGVLNFPPNYYMAGAQCNGSFCDNMRFWVCSKTG